eukprot:scaffold2882_cov359-Pinguiococcus_pyrenoidosus.AAC.4
MAIPVFNDQFSSRGAAQKDCTARHRYGAHGPVFRLSEGTLTVLQRRWVFREERRIVGVFSVAPWESEDGLLPTARTYNDLRNVDEVRRPVLRRAPRGAIRQDRCFPAVSLGSAQEDRWAALASAPPHRQNRAKVVQGLSLWLPSRHLEGSFLTCLEAWQAPLSRFVLEGSPAAPGRGTAGSARESWDTTCLCVGLRRSRPALRSGREGCDRPSLERSSTTSPSAPARTRRGHVEGGTRPLCSRSSL